MLLGTLQCFSKYDNIEGKWQAEDNGKIIEIYKDKDGLFYGKDIETGSIMIKGLRYDSSSQKYIGKMKPPDKDIELKASMVLIDKDRIKISIRMFIFSKSMYLARLKIN